ncbi:unnamed protein product [Dovyalis caffra]|uniref:Uncharacterized protein n=1 Tax=Dovyalis caffra TaxID=77055 RepID=A0AAV1SSU4_9ROSI|nr:unnamed protein product [Dovyalis caffra]
MDIKLLDFYIDQPNRSGFDIYAVNSLRNILSRVLIIQVIDLLPLPNPYGTNQAVVLITRQCLSGTAPYVFQLPYERTSNSVGPPPLRESLAQVYSEERIQILPHSLGVGIIVRTIERTSNSVGPHPRGESLAQVYSEERIKILPLSPGKHTLGLGFSTEIPGEFPPCLGKKN